MDNFEDDLAGCINVLNKGGIIAYPTDTVWGLGCDATNETAVQKIFELKNRPPANAMIALVAEERDVLKYVAAVDLSLFDYLKQTAKPTTVVYDHALGLAQNLLGSDGSVGIRICQDPFCRNLLKRFRKPLVSTSANFSGQATPANFTAISQELLAGCDYIVNHRRNDTAPATPSSVIRWKNGTPTVLRP